MLKTIAKLFLWLIGAAFPLLLAACYGAPAGFSRSGKVIDQTTKKGIFGLKVTCMVDGQPSGYDTTNPDGGFRLYSDCDSLLVQDVDGAENGAYAETTVPVCLECPNEPLNVVLAAK